MNISYHPKFKKKAIELKEFLKKNKIKQEINYIIGGDGSLFTYLSYDKPNFLISPKTSVGYYSSANFNDYQDKIRDYLTNKKHKEFLTIQVTINGQKTENALNDVLITEGLHKYSKIIINGNEEYNSGILIYTQHGFSGYAYKLGAKKYESNELGLIAFCPSDNSQLKNSIKIDKLTIKIIKRTQSQSFNLYIDCKDIKPFDKKCTDRKKIYYKPYKLKPGDTIEITKGKPITIIK